MQGAESRCLPPRPEASQAHPAGAPRRTAAVEVAGYGEGEQSTRIPGVTEDAGLILHIRGGP